MVLVEAIPREQIPYDFIFFKRHHKNWFLFTSNKDVFKTYSNANRIEQSIDIQKSKFGNSFASVASIMYHFELSAFIKIFRSLFWISTSHCTHTHTQPVYIVQVCRVWSVSLYYHIFSTDFIDLSSTVCT